MTTDQKKRTAKGFNRHLDLPENAPTIKQLGRAGQHDAVEPVQTKSGWKLQPLMEVLQSVFPPDGRVPAELSHKAVKARLEPEYKKRDLPVPSVDTIARARGRRK